MNRRIEDRKPDGLLATDPLIPFLNGGLFEPHTGAKDDDFYNGQANYALKVPDDWLVDLFALLERYNFTITESAGINVQVAVDPEMLGRIFENLLAEAIDESGEVARKATGSYYTPRVIVDYMVGQSLKQYLLTKTSLGEERIDRLLAYGEQVDDFGLEQRRAVISALTEVKVLDPACGSGAFPIGMLHRMLMALEKVDLKLEIWRGQYLGSLDPVVRQTVEKNISRENWKYVRKLMIIRDCIYGVDIQPIAVELARLRCFLSLVVDADVLDEEPNRGIEPLPNLEFKFVAANTLIGLPDKVTRQHDLGGTLDLKRELKELRNKYLKSYAADKDQTRKDYYQKQHELFRKSVEWLLNDREAKQLVDWDPFSYAASDWFDADLMFGVSSGFDIAIGNPPYLESRSPGFTSQLKDCLRIAVRERWGDPSKCITRGSDLLIYFLESSLHWVKKNGVVVLITQNAWLDTLYGKEFQGFLLKSTNVRAIIDSDFKYFDSKSGPNINTVICIFSGRVSRNSNVLRFARFHVSFDSLGANWDDYQCMASAGQVDFAEYAYSNPLLKDLKWGILATLDKCALTVIQRLFEHGRPLKDLGLDISIGQGLNLTADCIIGESVLDSYPVLKTAAIPFMTSADGAPFVLRKTNSFLIDKSKLNPDQRLALKKAGVKPFDRESTTKSKPSLIMPRGVSRHFCALNRANAYSSSCVDVYVSDRPKELPEVLNLWLLFNSSPGWMLREITGRKNLGGGLLKAEAADIGDLPIYLDFGCEKDISALCQKLVNREAGEIIDEVHSSEHERIDDIVCKALGIDTSLRRQIVGALEQRIRVRSAKSAT
ncbi:MAG: Eco57I restriction-modification methylase domain-containing protein [Chloroflexi bacterium]|nr:Eco57I restriction-modification methylase domain-containing protein [Chloroflexota bacterium]